MHLRGPNDTYSRFLLQLVRRIDSVDDKLNDDQLDRIQKYMLGMDEDQITGNISIPKDEDYIMYVATMNKYFVPLLDTNSNGRYIINNTTVSQLASHRIKYPNPCPYGASCYRKNPQHLEEFQHPPKSVTTRRARSASPSTRRARSARNASPKRQESPRRGGTRKTRKHRK